MKKCWKWLLAVVAILLAGLLIWFLVDYFSIARLPKWEKRKVEKVYFEEYCGGHEGLYKSQPIIWYEDNAYVDEWGVWRYLGAYGECYAFLWIGDETNSLGEKMEAFLIQGLAKEVYYPRYAAIMLYHRHKQFPYEETLGNSFDDRMVSMHYLHEINNREEWLTDKQLEKLTRDVEKIANQHK